MIKWQLAASPQTQAGTCAYPDATKQRLMIQLFHHQAELLGILAPDTTK